MSEQAPYVFLGYERPDGTIGMDGPHGEDSDLSTTIAILRSMWPDTVRFWRVRMEPDRYGTHWPRFEDITQQAQDSGPELLPGGPFVANLVRKQRGLAPL